MLFSAKVTFGPKKAIFGDLGGETNSEWEFIWFHQFCGFSCFRDAEKYSCENSLILCYFMTKVNFMSFYDLRHVMENNLYILQPL